MGMTLVEAAKLKTNSGDALAGTIIEMYAGSSDILASLPFDDIPGNALSYNRETALPGVGFRGVNEAYTPSVGVLNPVTETLVIAGGELEVDRFIVRTGPANARSAHEAMKVRALGLAWTRKFIKGDSSSDPREFDGLQTRVTGSQLISAGSTANGAALSLAVLDEAIDQTLNPTHIICSKALARRFSAAARSSTVGGYITYEPNQLGQRVMQFNGLPILTVDLDNDGSAILPYTEAAASGTDTATSLYVVSIQPGALQGIQNGTMEVADLGEMESKPAYLTRVEWLCGMAIYNGRAVTRIRHIGNLAIVA